MPENNETFTTDAFSISFDGGNTIEASVLGSALSNLAFIIGKVVESEPTKPEYKLQVKTFEKGSFLIEFLFALVTFGQIAQFYTINDAAAMINILKGMFDIKKLLKGEKPKEVKEYLEDGYVQVSAPDGTQVMAPTGSKIVISSPEVDKRISEIAQVTRIHNPDGGLKLIHGQDVFYFEKESIEDIAIPAHVPEKNNSENSNTMRVLLPIKKPDLLGNGAWSFKYGKRTINATIEDKEFMLSVHQGKSSYKAGDKLDVDLTTITKLSPSNSLLKETYIISRVYGIIPGEQQTKL